jgi:hypothetical protein
MITMSLGLGSSKTAVRVMVVALLGVLVAGFSGPATAAGPNTGWLHREDGATSAQDANSSGGSLLRLTSWNSWFGNEITQRPQVVMYTNGSGTDNLWADFSAPVGQTLQAGQTYVADAGPSDRAVNTARLRVLRNGTMCGKTSDQLDGYNPGYSPFNPATGWFHVNEIEYAPDSTTILSFSATYEMNCQLVGGPLGMEGTVAVNATDPLAALPDAPQAPSALTGLKATNGQPSNGGDSITTLNWNPATDAADYTVDLMQSEISPTMPALVGYHDTRVYRGNGTSLSMTDVEPQDDRFYRVTPRGATGRLGPPSDLLEVMGNRVDLPSPDRTIAIGQQVTFSGRLTEPMFGPRGIPLDGPSLPGRAVVLCSQPTKNWVYGTCDQVDQTITETNGHFSLSARPLANHYYRVVVPSTSDMVGNCAYVTNALVSPRTDLRAPVAQVSSRTGSVRAGSVIHFTTSRSRAGSIGIVRLQRFDGRRWRTVVTARLGRGTHRLAIPYREHHRGLNKFRILKVADSRHVNGHSRVVRIQVR